ncbi:hypothetical protein CASFOL_000291 [Castilleja foliolosa]|uniref:C2 domain-containing protein n=1 Tax=Castilleja foliolosa TaxID=1961234 RepID=A0ABD3ENX3_9LAMI
MVLQSAPNTSPLCSGLSRRKILFFSCCLCASASTSTNNNKSHPLFRKRSIITVKNVSLALLRVNSGGNRNPFNNTAKPIVLKRFSDDEEYHYASLNTTDDETNYYSPNFGPDPIVGKLRNQLGVIHPIPIPTPPPLNRSIFGLFAFFFFVGVVFDKLWTKSRKRNETSGESKGGERGSWAQVPSGLSLFLEKDFVQRKESVEWVNMVLGKLWKVYRGGIENWLIGLLQPVIDNLQKPDYVERVEIKQFSLGDEPLSVRSVERRTSRRVNDLHIVGVRDFDIDGELWVKLRLVPTEPWVGAVSWAFVSLPKIKFELSPFRLFNLMAIPVLSMFLTKLLTEDLPKLFVRPKKIVLDFQKGKAVGPVPNDSKSGENQEGNNEFAGELSVTLLDARKLNYIFYGKTDPYVILRLGDQVIRSKRNSQTTVIGPPGQPIWNQDFHMLVADPREENLCIEVKDSLGFTDLTVGTAEVDLGSLKDTVPTDRIVVLRGGWSPFGNRSAGEILLRLTYKAYVEDEEDERSVKKVEVSEDDELSDSDDSDVTVSEQRAKEYVIGPDNKESFMEVLAALLVSEEFRGIVTSETVNTKSGDAGISSSASQQQNVPTAKTKQQFSAGDAVNSRGIIRDDN